MSTVRFTAEVLPDGTIQPPTGIHLAPGKAEVTVNTAESAVPQAQATLAKFLKRADQRAFDSGGLHFTRDDLHGRD
jgi:hypothetical protein